MIRILDRLVVRTFLKLFVVFLMAAPLLFVLGDYAALEFRFRSNELGVASTRLGHLSRRMTG
jgi:hypothetical protein